MLSLKRAKSASKTFEYSVFGFMREYEEDQSKIVPIMMKYICLNYYLLDEKFVQHGTKMELDKCANIIRLNGWPTANTAYGNVAITDCDESILEYQWTFKLLRYSPHLCVFIGIDSSNKRHINVNYALFHRNWSIFHAAMFTKYGMFLSDRGVRHYKYFPQFCEIQDGDCIVMKLNTNDKTLKFEMYEQEIVLLTENIELENGDYYMAVAMDHRVQSLQCLQLVDFCIKQRN